MCHLLGYQSMFSPSVCLFYRSGYIVKARYVLNPVVTVLQPAAAQECLLQVVRGHTRVSPSRILRTYQATKKKSDYTPIQRHIYIDIDIDTHTHTQTQTHTQTLTHTQTNIHTQTHKHTHAHTTTQHKHTHTQTQTHTHTHIQTS